jgi:branched-chain amino acid transport system permease protein
MHAPVTRRTYLTFALLWPALLALPLVAPNNYFVSLGVLYLINVILIASLNLLMGYAGQISLSHGAFYGLGAYASGVLGAKYGVSPWLGLLASVAISAGAALLIGLPSLRLRGHYLAMATLGFNAIVSVLFVELYWLTGGPNGLIGVPSISLFGWRINTDRSFYFLAWFASGLVMLLILNLIDSRVGRALRALSTSELAASCMGVDTFRTKLAVFVLTAVMASLAGFLYVHHISFASPESFNFGASVMLVVMVALGGTGSVWGPLLGAAMFTVLPEALRAFDNLEILLFGVSMVVVLLFFPGGLAALGRLLARGRIAPRGAP